MIWIEWIGTALSILGVALVSWGGRKCLMRGFVILSVGNFAWALVAYSTQLNGLLALEATLFAFNLVGIYRLATCSTSPENKTEHPI